MYHLRLFGGAISWPVLFSLVSLVVILCLTLYLAVLRPWHLGWGASRSELQLSLPGDDLVRNPTAVSTRAITIKAPAERIWPWVVQVGYKRAGWYNYDWINRVMGAADYVDGQHSADRVVPELQDLKIGDLIYMHRQGANKVVALETGKYFVLQGVDAKTQEVFSYSEPLPGMYNNFTWVFFLEPIDQATTRLLVRQRSEYRGLLLHVVFGLIDPGAFLMERAMLLGIKHRAEQMLTLDPKSMNYPGSL